MNKKSYAIGFILLLLITSLIPMSNSNNIIISKINNEINQCKSEDIDEECLDKTEHIDLFKKYFNFSETYEKTFDSNYTIKGIILDNGTSNPIPNVKVFMIWPESSRYPTSYSMQETITNSTGNYKFEINIERVLLFVHANDYYGDYSSISRENQNLIWSNFSLKHGRPSETSIIQGWVKGFDNEPVKNAMILNFWKYNEDNNTFNQTFTNEEGFFSLMTSQGVNSINVYAYGYYSGSSTQNITGDITYVNISIEPLPPENSIIKGYVLEKETQNRMSNVSASVSYHLDIEHMYINRTYTDIFGYYEMNIVSGENIISFNKNGYFSSSSDIFMADEDAVVWYNQTLVKKPPENSIINGFIYDNKTGFPINEASIHIIWRNDNGNRYSNYTYSNADGYYIANIANGTISVTVRKSKYFYEGSSNINISEYETLQLDVYLNPYPTEKSVIKGHIYDNDTGLPINNVDIGISWNNDNYYYSNSTKSNESGFYSINVANGTVLLNAENEDYFRSYSDYFNISDFEIIQYDFYLNKRPDESSTIFGYIIDKKTGIQIENAVVQSYWWDTKGNNLFNMSLTDSTGYYHMNVAEGKTRIYASKIGYHAIVINNFNISSYETIQMNFLLFPIQPENSRIYGYVKDNRTGLPIEGALISLFWKDKYGNEDWNQSLSDSNGNYSINVASGVISLNCRIGGYISDYTDEFTIDENNELRIDFYLDEKPSFVEISRPDKALYINSRKIIQLLFKPILIGDIDIYVFSSEDISRVELYIDGILKYTDDKHFFSWNWAKKSIIRHRHIIKAIGYDENGDKYFDRVYVLKYF